YRYFGYTLSPDIGTAVYRKAWQHLHAREEQGAVCDGKKQLLQWAVDTTWQIVFLWTTDRHGQQRTLACKSAFTIAIGITCTFVAVGQTKCPYPVNPPLHDCWHAVPPQREH